MLIDAVASCAQKPLRIAMVGKYNGLSDAYLSVIKALQHACIKCKSKLQVRLRHDLPSQRQKRALQSTSVIVS